MSITPDTDSSDTHGSAWITADTEITEDQDRATRLAILEAQVVRARDDLSTARDFGDMFLALAAVEQLATLQQHILQELALLARETSPR